MKTLSAKQRLTDTAKLHTFSDRRQRPLVGHHNTRMAKEGAPTWPKGSREAPSGFMAKRAGGMDKRRGAVCPYGQRREALRSLWGGRAFGQRFGHPRPKESGPLRPLWPNEWDGRPSDGGADGQKGDCLHRAKNGDGQRMAKKDGKGAFTRPA
jgi:hypothetical protein